MNDPANGGHETESQLKAEGLEILDGSLPWRDPALLPDKPGGYLFGVRFRNHPQHGDSDRPVGTARDVISVLETERERVDKVYLPEEDRGVPRRSLNCYPPYSKKDYWNFFLQTLSTRGLLGVAALGAAGFVKPELSISLFLLALLFGLIPVFDAFLLWLLFPGGMTREELKKGVVHSVMFQDWVRRSPRSRAAIWSLVLVFVAVFVGQLHNGVGPPFDELTTRGSIHPTPVREAGEWWRLFTGTLMHANIYLLFHIGLNSLGLVYLGKYIHRLTNPLIVPIVFVVSALVGAFASVLFWGARPGIGSVGASGGVVGLIGFLVGLQWMRRGAFPDDFRMLTVRNVILLVVIGVAGLAFIDNAGHGGGLVAGLLCSLIYCSLHRDDWEIPNSPALIAGAILSFLAVGFGLLTSLDLSFFDGRWIAGRLPRIPW